ncbi:hypothetical protein GGI13_001187 [Coemansia sp. RSA 455]|nr:hypothetical protein LPJ71_000217 [Coemansia sp. S17]KAJ2013377.1 hypothetical protein GGI14_005410 [Coemansia sp. S680]KAJ2041467.1 hypothetical protein H4S03_000347 [Coemansia sp. S3946]KAJ2071081.1 hypothetical protein GGH13_003594 [Coemansia sp. S155-1]KAJ2102719.1 hypothetical protein GGI09_001061 [Coemansia sp. S100]KAJ2105737.1 hypothetical protein GGI16_002227 [Coemansia sp. S142-1]KAJ2256459.1 hypothetical protein GGI13_001187 [Coemansia sp. RSA 455]KAJ2341071.1 hypothetical prot
MSQLNDMGSTPTAEGKKKDTPSCAMVVATSSTSMVTTPASTAMSWDSLRWFADAFKEAAPTFSGGDDELSSTMWIAEIRKELQEGLPGASQYMLYKMVYEKLTGKAAKAIQHPTERTLDNLFAVVEAEYPPHHYQDRIMEELRDGTAFKSETRNTIVPKARKILEIIGDLPSGPETLALALEKVAPILWTQQRLRATTATRKTLATAINGFEETLNADTLTKLNLGSPDKPKNNPKPRGKKK